MSYVFEVRGSDGSYWASYLYRAMACEVAARCNASASLRDSAPFRVVRVRRDLGRAA